MYEMHGWTWGGWGKDIGYTPEAEAIAQTITRLLADLEENQAHNMATGRLMVMRGDDDVTVYLELGYADKYGYVSCDNDVAELI